MQEIEHFSANNPRQFWEHIKKLGPNKRKEIPLCVKNEDDTLESSEKQVLLKWQNDFASLYRNSPGNKCKLVTKNEI